MIVPNLFDVGLKARKAIYSPFPQAVPSAYLIDMETCLGTNPIACGKCAEVCEKGCIDYDMEDQNFDVEVGDVVVATDMEVYDPTELDEFGYTKHHNVITNLEFERLSNATGPTSGKLLADEEITGRPHAWASKMGMPNPS